MSVCSENNFIDISHILSGEEDSLLFDRKFVEKYEENGLETDGFSVSGRVFGSGEDISLEGEADFTVSSVCARCLKPVKKDISVKFAMPVGNFDEDGETEEFAPVEDSKIDIYSLGFEKLILNLPFRLLCNEDCKGICSKCGKDLNLGDCGCSDKEIDPRLAGLSDFFK